MEIIRLKDIPSTNDYALELRTDEDVCVVSDYQSKGKGMGTNVWESEKGKNLLFSILLHPLWLDIRQQFLISMAHAVALREVLSQVVPKHELLTIKWPNDIYYGDRKISGTRIDANLNGSSLQDMVIGTGINVNQKVFYSDAPNPTSLVNITGKEFDRYKILDRIILTFEKYLSMLSDGNSSKIIELYHQHLYRREGLYHYKDEKGDFMAELISVSPSGFISLKRENGKISEYEYKELVYLYD